ncbi:helix-turn-helix domain-containing protein [Herbidospora mongoliensis]|uniref:helix-turn-helix domain-containing protein n=1 Tax=Herbidospora mongoliensis TaxID=688067 RepID=UPI00083287D8|nr:helix-turn-helix domain-containing protein [Herbidospora mongoliensis]
MRELVGRLAALDPDASAAVQVIAYFDRLAEGRAGVEATVRGVAVLAGCAARLVDEERGVFLRVLADGHRDDHADPPSDEWPRRRAGDVELVLEKAGSPSPVDLMVLERGVALARDVLDRTRGRAPDPALVELGASTSLRTAATQMNLHHSTLVDRLGRAEQLLGWDVRDPGGRFRLQLAFALRRLHAHPE